MRTLERSLLRTLERALERTAQRDANTRECNAREEKGREVVGSPPIHNVAQVTREPVDAWMDEIDLTEDVPCVGWSAATDVCDYGSPADYITRTCGGRTYALCRACHAWPIVSTCSTTGTGELPRHHFRIVEVLR